MKKIRTHPIRKLLLVAATEKEILPLQSHLEENYEQQGLYKYLTENIQCRVLVTGVGNMQMGINTTIALHDFSADLAILVGVAGARKEIFKLGDVVRISSEQPGWLGIEESDGSFTSIFDTDLADADLFPFQRGKLYAPRLNITRDLRDAAALTINLLHGTSAMVRKTLQTYDHDVESMEGAGFFYACLMAQIPFLELRGISNWIEPRQRENWQVEKAIEEVNDKALSLLGRIVREQEVIEYE